MAGVNKAILIGNLGSDPETRYTKSDMAVCSFRMATTERTKDGERTEWHRVVAFGKLAEICGEYLHKGKPVYIEGRIQTREWDDKAGNKRWTTEIVANSMQMLGGKVDGGGSSSGSRENDRREEPRREPARENRPNQTGPNDDIPF